MGVVSLQKSTKELLIEILGRQFPLSLRQLSKEVRITKNVSYQAVHKALKELAQDGVVEKVDKHYFLNKSWVKKQTVAFSGYYNNYFHTSYNPNQISEKSQIQVFRFTSLKDILDFIVEAILQGKLSKQPTREIYVSVRRLHPLVPGALLQVIKKILKEHQIYIICKSNTFADKWAARLLRSMGLKVKTGVNIPHQNAVCMGDCVLQYFLFFTDAYKKKVHSFSDAFKGRSSMQLVKFTSDAFHKQAEMYLVLNRYPVFVKDIKDKVSKVFE